MMGYHEAMSQRLNQLRSEIRGKIVMPVVVLSRLAEDGKVKEARSALESLWEIVDLLKDKETKGR